MVSVEFRGRRHYSRRQGSTETCYLGVVGHGAELRVQRYVFDVQEYKYKILIKRAKLEKKTGPNLPYTYQ